MFDISLNLKKLPDKPGVYLHKDALGEVIYVGKAISLKKRVRSYFNSNKNHSLKVKAMVKEIREFEYIICANELEALILECNLIKKYRPKYNVLLRDDKTYPYIAITMSEDFPRIIKTRNMQNDKYKYFGPYSDVAAVNLIIDYLNDTLKLKQCSILRFPKGFKPCLNYHIDRCKGICVGEISKEEYDKSIKQAISFLKGNTTDIVLELTEKMQEASWRQEYEHAARYRDMINACKSLSEKQRVSLNQADSDVLILVKHDKWFVAVFCMREGKLISREFIALQCFDTEDRDEILKGFIMQHYTNVVNPPKEIIVNEPIQNKALLEEFLSKSHKVSITQPQKGKKMEILKLAMNDVLETLNDLKEKEKNRVERDEKIASLLSEMMMWAGYDKSVSRIESYDISHTGGNNAIGAMVVFDKRQKIKKAYRQFKIEKKSSDDIQNLYEVIFRRLKRAKNLDEAFLPLPDLILMDGGVNQVNSAIKAMKEIGIEVPVLGLVKDSSHRTRAIVDYQGREFALKQRPLLYRYFGVIQEEVHRYALEYHVRLRGKKLIASQLDLIKGIGPQKKKALLKHFGNLDAIKLANKEQLLEVQGINEALAENIIKFFS